MRRTLSFVFGAVYIGAVALTVGAQQPPQSQQSNSGDGPQYQNGMQLVRPQNYREWRFLSSGVGMTYAALGALSLNAPSFGNVFVNPSSYQSFMQTGRWPDRTIFVLETRASSTEGSIVQGGRFQTGLSGLEAEVKDARFPDGWAFFNFGSAQQMRDVIAPLSGDAVAGCVDCHTKNTAVERTFVQFYPVLLDVARAKRTLKPGF